MLFSLYIAPIGDMLRSLDINFRIPLYADDVQLYVTFKSSNPDKLMAAKLLNARLRPECVCELDERLAMNELKYAQ